MEFEVLGWPPGGPRLQLDHRRFAYAGKFVITRTGKAVARNDGEVLGASAFDPDRTDGTVLRIRYVTVRRDRQGEGIGARLLAFTADRAHDRGFDRIRIAVNNPVAYQAAYRSGFGFTGEETGLAELVLDHPGDRSSATYRRGLARFLEREDLSASFRHFVRSRLAASTPDPLIPPEPT